jgi:dihydroorotate dehydrogenase electron transfer subunit
LNRLFKATVVENKQIINNHYLITLHPLEKIQKPKPGNFFMLSVGSGLDPLLKRPLSIHRLVNGGFQHLYRLVGKGTDMLSKRRPGDTLEILGPLGNSFPVPKANDKMILVAGGLGIAPVFSIAEKYSKRKPLLFYGAKTINEVLCINELKSIGIDPVLSSDDGTVGKKGNIVNVLKKYLVKQSSSNTRCVIYACGPGPMLKSISALSEKHNVSSYIALEQTMACGLGTCLGCVVSTTAGYKRVCREGPVFPAEEIVWD